MTSTSTRPIREEEKKLAEELLFAEKKQPSFAKQLFFGHFDANLVFPYPQPAQDEATLESNFLNKVSAFAKEHIDAAKIDKEAKIPDVVIQGLAHIGVLGMTVPPRYEGLGMSQRAYCRTTEMIARFCGSTALFINVHQSIGLKALLLYGSKAQQDKWLPLLAKGEKYAAFSLTEPNAGSDANGVETRAVYDPEKKIYRINGLKQWTTSGGIADVLTVMAKTAVKTPQGVEDKVTAFLVTPDMPGFVVRDRALEKLGMRGTWTANLAFNNLEVPEENILGPLGKGLKVCLTVLDYGRTTFGSTCTGVAKELVERSLKHAKERHQFGRSLASFSLVKKKIATMSSLVYAMDATTYLTASFIDRQIEDFMLESAMLKVFTSDALWQILYDSMQILGGRSFFTNEPYERMMRDARLNMIGEGSNEVLRAFIGVVGLRDVGMELKDLMDALKTPFSQFSTLSCHVGSLFYRMRAPQIPVRSSHLQTEAKALSHLIRSFYWAGVRLLGRHGENIVEKQLQLNRMASIAMSIYTCSAVLSKLDAQLANQLNKIEPIKQDYAAGTYYVHQQVRYCKRLFRGITSNCDQMTESLSEIITGIV